MPGERHLGADLFALPREDGSYHLYAPLRHATAVVNDSTVTVVARYLRDGREALGERERELIAELEQAGLLGGEEPAPPVVPPGCGFCPHETTLFLTSRCNLRCRYCYADAGRKNADMAWETARAAIDLVATNAGLLGSRDFGVGFHGGGEPTLAWDLLVQCTEHARRRADELGLDVQLYAATNGVVSEKQRRYVVANFTTVNVSLDGPAAIQNYNRPTAAGGESYERVRETLVDFDEKGFHYGLRATITERTVERMVEIVEALAGAFRPAYLHLEPSWFCGRCITSGERPPRPDAFVRNFIQATEAGKVRGVDVSYSGARLGTLTSRFCAAAGAGFNVLPEGVVTSCYEVTEASDARADVFHYGRYDPESGSFRFDQERIEALQRLSVEHLPFCADCFCKWHCAGDCLAKAFQQTGAARHAGTGRCEVNRALTLERLEQLVAEEQLERRTGVAP